MDYGRKNYQDRQYQDWLRRKTAKSVWNQVLEAYPGNAEFSRSSKTAMQSNVSRYLKQSEFKKPYLDNDFVNMEGEWEGPGGGIPYEPGGPDINTNLNIPIPVTETVFNIDWDGEYCPYKTKTIKVSGTEPIVFVELSTGTLGVSLINLKWIDDNNVQFDLDCDEVSGSIIVWIGMESVEGLTGTVNALISEESGCCGSILTYNTNQLKESFEKDANWSTIWTAPSDVITTDTRVWVTAEYLVPPNDEYRIQRVSAQIYGNPPSNIIHAYMEMGVYSMLHNSPVTVQWFYEGSYSSSQTITTSNHDDYKSGIAATAAETIYSSQVGDTLQMEMTEAAIAAINASGTNTYHMFWLAEYTHDVLNSAPPTDATYRYLVVVEAIKMVVDCR